MNRIYHGIIHGTTIELQEDPQVADGQKVQVIVKTIDNPEP